MVFARTRKQWERARTEPVESKRSEPAPAASESKPKRKPRRKKAAEQ